MMMLDYKGGRGHGPKIWRQNDYVICERSLKERTYFDLEKNSFMR